MIDCNQLKKPKSQLQLYIDDNSLGSIKFYKMRFVIGLTILAITGLMIDWSDAAPSIQCEDAKHNQKTVVEGGVETVYQCVESEY